jgi:hypothetical protein
VLTGVIVTSAIVTEMDVARRARNRFTNFMVED